MYKKIEIETKSLNFNITGNGNPVSEYNSGQIVDIPNELIIENNKQYFKIHEETIAPLADRIQKDGQLSPCIVVPVSGGKYELIDGRHRRRAIIKAGLPTTKCVIRTDLADNQKAVIRITSNLFRNNDYLPSEIALSLKELIELEGGNDAIKKISEETHTNRKKIYRYIRLTYLIKELLERVDKSNIPIIAAVEISYLSEHQQKNLFQFLLNHSDCRITTSNAHDIKENPDNLDNIFYPKKSDNYELEKNLYESNVDNLSTISKQADSYDNKNQETAVSLNTNLTRSKASDTQTKNNKKINSNSKSSASISTNDIIKYFNNAWKALCHQYDNIPDESTRIALNLLAKMINKVTTEIQKNHNENGINQLSVDDWISWLKSEV